MTHLHSNTYFARIVLAMPDKEGGAAETDVDARPSDAINLAVRCGAPIYVSADVARTHGVRSSMPESGSSSSATSGDTDTPSAESLPAAPVRLLDKTLELRMRLAVAVQESRLSDAQSLRDDIAVLLAGDSSTVRAVAAAQLIYEIEVRVFAPRVRVCSPPLTPHIQNAIREERWKDAAQARNHLAELNHVVRPNFMLNRSLSDDKGDSA